MHKLEVGKLYIKDKTLWPDGVVEYNYTANGHTLLILFSNPSQQEIDAVKRGKKQFWLYIDPNTDIIFLMFKFQLGKDVVLTGDSSFNYHLVPEHGRKEPDTVGEKERSLLSIILVDSNTGIIKAMNASTFTHLFSVKLHESIYNQINSTKIPKDKQENSEAVSLIYNTFEFDDLIDMSIVKSTQGE